MIKRRVILRNEVYDVAIRKIIFLVILIRIIGTNESLL